MNPLIRRATAVCCALAVLGLWTAPGIQARSAKDAKQESSERKNLFKDYSHAEFKKLKAPRQEIGLRNFQEDLLSAAIFHETNARREKHGLARLDYHPRVNDAAEKHANRMAKGNYLSHGTPDQPKNTTHYERLKQQGLNPKFSAENVAFNFLLKYESGKAYYTREENGRAVYSYEPGGKPLQPHTYLSFAEAIVNQWMNSRGHRKNILASEPKFLGIGSALSQDGRGFARIYCDQHFFAPLPERAVPAP